MPDLKLLAVGCLSDADPWAACRGMHSRRTIIRVEWQRVGEPTMQIFPAAFGTL